MNLSLEELYNQYQHSIEVQKNLIDDYRKKLNSAHKSHNTAEVMRLNRMMRVLYEEKWEMEGHAVSIREYLKN